MPISVWRGGGVDSTQAYIEIGLRNGLNSKFKVWVRIFCINFKFKIWIKTLNLNDFFSIFDHSQDIFTYSSSDYT